MSVKVNCWQSFVNCICCGMHSESSDEEEPLMKKEGREVFQTPPDPSTSSPPSPSTITVAQSSLPL